MDMLTYMNCLKNNSLKNPIEQATNELLVKLESIPLVGLSEEAITAFNETKANLLKQANDSAQMLSGVKDSLPLLKASDSMSSKMKIMKGIMPSVEGGDAIKGITGTIKDLSEKAANFSTSVSAQVDALAGAGSAAIQGFVSDLSASAAAHIEETAAGFSGVADSISGAVTDLKDYAFAKFSSLPQPPALSELMASILPDACEAPRPETIKTEENIAREVTEKKYEETINPATPTSTDLFEADAVPPATNTEDAPAPTINGMTVQQLKDSVYVQIDYCHDKRKELIPEINNLLFLTKNKRYEVYPDYDAVWSGLKSGDLAATNKFNKMAEHLRTIEPFVTWIQKEKLYSQYEMEIERLEKLLKSWALNNYENVPNGPPW
jgi:hypothetical protein